MEPRKFALDRSDSSSPNFITINSKGEVTVEFEGKIIALGLVLHEKEFVEATNSIEWLDGALVTREKITGAHTGGNHVLQLQAIDSELTTTQLQLISNNIQSQLVAVVSLASATILDAGQSSSFLQLRTGVSARHHIEFGVIETEFEGAFVFSNVILVSHGLGFIPKVVLATAQGLGGVCFGVARLYTNVNFELFAVCSTGVLPKGTKEKIAWCAIS